MVYRIAKESDAEPIAHLHAESWRNTYRGMLSDAYLDNDVFAERRLHWQKRFDNPASNQWILVAESEGEIVGFVCNYGADDEKWGTLIDNLHVRPDQKGRGIGTHLIQKAMDWAQENYPETGVHLFVFEANESARYFYEKMGGTNVERFLHHNEDNTEGYALRYAW
ncbi:MAG: GNAT family N-acetyltransferase [Saprospiraceae bacterium]|nr:GNAT family N-acetyltransferase [Saprospiraceae bacterium]